MEKIKFFNSATGEEVLFEVLDETVLEGCKYILVADSDDEATILRELRESDEEITYQLVEDENEFKKVAVEFMTNEEYDIEI